MANGSLINPLAVTNLTFSNVASGASVTGIKTGRLVSLHASINGVPASSLTKIADTTEIPSDKVSCIVANAQINAYGQLRVDNTGKIEIYHTNGSTMNFLDMLINYII